MSSQKTNQKEANYELNQALANLGFDVIQELSICLSDIPKERLRKGSNGKVYCNITVGTRKEPDQWGRNLKVYISPTKQDKEEKLAKIYVGAGKTFIFAQGGTSEINKQDLPWENNDEESDLPY